MFKIYTATHSSELASIKADVEFPENGLSPWEQIQWVRDNQDKQLTIKTFSPFILAMFNVVIAENKWTDKDIQVICINEGLEMSTLGKSSITGEYFIDNYDVISEPMSAIMNAFAQGRGMKGESQATNNE